jgi:hypothetical protein
MKKNQKIKKIRSASARTTAPPRIFFRPAQEKYLYEGNAISDENPTIHFNELLL